MKLSFLYYHFSFINVIAFVVKLPFLTILFTITPSLSKEYCCSGILFVIFIYIVHSFTTPLFVFFHYNYTYYDNFFMYQNGSIIVTAILLLILLSLYYYHYYLYYHILIARGTCFILNIGVTISLSLLLFFLSPVLYCILFSCSIIISYFLSLSSELSLLDIITAKLSLLFLCFYNYNLLCYCDDILICKNMCDND